MPPPPVPRSAPDGPVLAAIAVGGVLGACARYGATLLWSTGSGAFPWTTFWINVTGSALMGVVLVLTTELSRAHPLARPLLGTGVLGGYTTFSTYALDAEHLAGAHRAGLALLYLTTTLLVSLAAAWAGATITRSVARPRLASGGVAAISRLVARPVPTRRGGDAITRPVPAHGGGVISRLIGRLDPARRGGGA